MWIPLFLCWFTVTPPTGNVERILEALAVVTDASGELGAVDVGYSAQILRNVLTSDTKLLDLRSCYSCGYRYSYAGSR